jgi:hypothetical protein
VGQTRVGFGRLRITEQVTGYDRKLVATGRSIGMVPLDLPRLEFDTHGLWIQIPDQVRDRIESDCMHFMGGIHAMEHAAIGIMPLLVMTDRNDLGGISIPFHDQVQTAAVFVYDAVPGGLGLCRQAFEQADRFLSFTLEAITSCRCDTGCPACVHSPKCGSGTGPLTSMQRCRSWLRFSHPCPVMCLFLFLTYRIRACHRRHNAWPRLQAAVLRPVTTHTFTSQKPGIPLRQQSCNMHPLRLNPHRILACGMGSWTLKPGGLPQK